MIIRKKYFSEIKLLFETFSVVAILGPRQCGKTTIAKQYYEDIATEKHYFDLERERDWTRLQEAELALENLGGLIIIDEIQRRPNLFPNLRYLIDHKRQNYLILGSASRDLIHQSSETLAGRIAYVELPPFGLDEVNATLNDLWVRGGFPRSLLAHSTGASYRWRQEYIKTFLERDLALLGLNLNSSLIGRLWQMLAHYHGQIMNVTDLSMSLGVTQRTVNRYIEALEGAFMVRKLQPWHENLKKRQVKSPKIYVRDSGLLHALIKQKTIEDISGHPKLGASWEGFAIEELIKFLQPDEVYFWNTFNQAELDLLILKDGKRLGYEFKYSYTPKITKSTHTALADLRLDSMTIILPGGDPYKIAEKIEVTGLPELIKNAKE